MSGLDSAGWQQRYEERKTGWDRGECSDQLIHWLDRGVLEPCRILIPGCGNGYEVVELASRGFEVTAVDYAPAPLTSLQSRLSKRNLQAELLEVDVLTYEPPKTAFDAVYDQTFLCAIEPALRRQYVEHLRTLLRPGGRLFVLFMQCNDLGRPGPPFHCDIAEMRELFDASAWLWPDELPMRVEHPGAVYELATVLRNSAAVR